MRTKIPRIVFQAALIALFALPVSAGWPPVYTENFDNVRSPTLPSGWVASQGINVTGAPLWLTSLVSPSSAPNDAFSEAPDNILDNRLDTPVLPITGFSNAITFRHSYDLAGGLDGAVLEASSPDINGGAFTDITDPAVGGQFLGPGGYNTTISSAFQSPIAGRMAWSGNSGGYVTTTVGFPIPTFSGLKLRFRLVTDNSGASGGWRIDNLVVPRTEGSSPTPTPPPAPTPTPTPIPTPCGGPNVIADSTFEAGTPWPAWTVQTSTNFGTPLCDIAACGSSGPSQPYAGSNWAWFGGAAAAETATLGQSVTFPAGGQATLSFEMRIGAVSFQLTDVLNVRVDGTVVQSYPEPGNAEDAYSLRTIDVGAFADGAAHDILFEYIGPTTGSSIYAVDNVTLTDGVACPTPPPTVTPTATPSASPTATIFPTVTPTPSDCPGGGCTPTPSIPPPATATPSPSLTPTPTPPPTPTPTATPSPTPAQALNISTRLRVETGERIAIGGFIITGNASKRVALRGLGPSLGNSGLSDVLIDPILELRGSDGTLLLQNDNWEDDPFGGGGTALVALGLAPQNPNESGMVATLEPGSYTAFLSGKNQTSGLGLVEVYDVDTAADSQLANISTRGFVRTADDVMIGGFILGQGGGNTSVAVRGLGPSLGQVGLSNVLADPTLELHDGNGALLIANDNWQDDPVSAAQLTLHGLAPTNDLESGIFTTLPPGLFTAILAGKNGGIGLGLVEVYGGTSGTALNVTNTADSGAGSLRQTLADANDGDTIRFNTALNGQTITLTSAELVIDKSIAISGPGPKQLTVERSTATGIPEFRIFHVLPGQTVLIEGLEISGGRLPDAGTGGGVRNDQGTLTLNNCAVMSNIGGQFGGGVYNDGAKASLTLVNCTINYNYVGLPAGGSMGGGIYNNNGTVEITDSTINGNFATYVGGGIYNTSGGTLSIHGSVVDDNAVMVQFSNPPQFVGSCGGIFNAGTAEVSNCAISHNTGGTEGGGIDNQGSLSIADSTIDHNTVIGVGGGIYSRGPLTIGNSTISGNTANFKGLGNGGGIDSESASLAITNSTFSGNTVADPFGQGGGIFIAGGTLQLQNTILNASGMGGSIHNESGTVTSNGYNLSSDDGGGFLIGVGDQINTDPILGPLQDNDGPTFTHALLSGSPAINAGDPSFASPPLYDQRGPGYDRVAGGRIDIGSFEVPAGLALRFRH